jgi:hypothetical protein
MARIIVQADDRRTVLLDEQDVKPEHLSDKHSAVQIIERLEWAVRDESARTSEPVGGEKHRRRLSLP